MTTAAASGHASRLTFPSIAGAIPDDLGMDADEPLSDIRALVIDALAQMEQAGELACGP